MRLFWSSRSPFVRKVMIVAHELGIAGEIETMRVVVQSSNPNPEVMKFNPLGKVPTLIVRDDFVLYDSRAISEYLDATHGKGNIFPADGPERWQALKRQALADGIMETDIMWLGERNRKPDLRSEALIAGCRKKIGAAVDALEGDPGLMAKDEVTIGQIAAVSALAHLDFRFPDEPWRPSRPKLAAWFEAFSRRPSVEATAYVDIY
jgi:glutathione S-transferase